MSLIAPAWISEGGRRRSPASIPIRTRPLALIAALALCGVAAAAPAQTLSGAALARALKAGGYVIVMRHAHAPQTPPTAAQADRGNVRRERQLDAAGQASARAMGAAIRRLHIRVGKVWSSPTYRALETVRLAGLPRPATAPQLGDQGHSMRAVGEDLGAWLRSRAGEPPRPGTDTFVVTQDPNIRAAFGSAAAGLHDGEALVFRPSAGTTPQPVARIPIEAWPTLGAGTAGAPGS